MDERGEKKYQLNDTSPEARRHKLIQYLDIKKKLFLQRVGKNFMPIWILKQGAIYLGY